MKRNNKYQALSLAAVIMVICSLTLGYAALTQTLNINFGATVQSGQTTWNIHFKSTGVDPIVSGATSAGIVDLQSTTITITNLLFKKSGDSVTYNFKVVNDGEVDARISIMTPLIVQVSGGTEAEQAALKDGIEYTLKYADGTEVKLDDKLNSKEEKVMNLTITLKEGTSLPTSNITISNIGYTLTYTESSSNIAGGGSTVSGLNEYGFYFNQRYTGLSASGDKMSIIFYEDGSAKVYANGAIVEEQPTGTLTYAQGKAYANGEMFEFSQDGKQMILFGVTFYLEYLSRVLNEYGFYFDIPYINYEVYEEQAIRGGVGIEFHEDGSGEMLEIMQTLQPMFYVENGQIRDANSDELVGEAIAGGSQIKMYTSTGDGVTTEIMTLQGTPSSQVSEDGIYYNEWYKMYIADFDQEAFYMFLENGNMVMRGVVMEFPTGTITYETKKATIPEEPDSLIFEFSEDGMFLTDKDDLVYSAEELGNAGNSEDNITYVDFVLSNENYQQAGLSSLEGNIYIPKTFYYDGKNYKIIGIADATFFGNNITSVNIPNSIESIGHFAFTNCSNLTGTLTIPNSVKTIGGLAYTNTGYSSLSIGSGLETLGGMTFAGMDNLATITVNSNNAYFMAENNILFDKNKTLLITYPPMKTDTTYIVPNGVTKIDGGAFEGQKHLTSVTLPEGLTTIGEEAFNSCSNLKKINIPSTVTKIENIAFCFSGLTSVEYKGTTYTSKSALESALTANGVSIVSGIFEETGLSE